MQKALSEICPEWQSLDGLIICGTHSPHDTELLIRKTKEARETHRPFLGICFGHQLAFIEHCRNILGIKDATSEEFGKGTFVVIKRPEGLKVGLHDGETYWNNYECIQEWTKPDNFITTQAHPEYQSSIDKPHPILVKFIELCKQYTAAGRQV